MSESYLITDFSEFCLRLYQTLGEINQLNNLDQYITRAQFDEIMKNHVFKDDDDYYIEEEAVYEAMCEASDLLNGSLLSKMASKGLIDCAWDDEKQDMIFWATKEGKQLLENQDNK
jgi:hypothetical protein